MTLHARTFDDDLVEIEIEGAFEERRQHVILKPEEARSLASDLETLSDRQDRTVQTKQ